MKHLIAVVSLAALLVASTVAMAAEDIVVGAGFLLSGRFATYGEAAKAGVDMKVKEVNDAGGLLGRKLVIDYVDTKADRALAVANYRKWGAQKNVAAMLTISSIEFLALDPVGPEVKLPFVSVGSAAAIDEFKPWSFRVALIVSKAIGQVLDELKSMYGIKSVGVIYDTTNNFTVSEMETVKNAAPKANLRLTGIESFTGGDQDFALQISRMKQDEPDLVYLAATTGEAALFISQMRAFGMKSRIIGGAGLNDPHIADLPGKAANGVMTYFPFDVNDPRPLVQDFVKQYKAGHGGNQPSAFVAAGWDAINLIVHGIREAGSLDRDKIRQAMASTKDLEGMNGTFSYDGAGDNLIQKPNIFAMTDGAYKRISK